MIRLKSSVSSAFDLLSYHNTILPYKLLLHAIKSIKADNQRGMLSKKIDISIKILKFYDEKVYF